jgi:hypothetical protein
VRATVLQVTRSPGKPIVYLGSLLLVLGVFAMLYIRERRLFVLIKASGEALVALSSNRKSLDVDESFRQHRDALAALLNPNPAPDLSDRHHGYRPARPLRCCAPPPSATGCSPSPWPAPRCLRCASTAASWMSTTRHPAACVPGLAAIGWAWKPFRAFLAAAAALALASITLYQGDLARAEQVFFLKYLISSQTAIMWMSALFFIATGAYWLGLLARSDFAEKTGSALTWCAVTMGTTGLMVRWYESYLIGTDVGHIPVSNLYEVFVLFSLITGLLYLYYEGRYATRRMGAFVLLVISAAVAFLLWYSFSREAQEIQPLIPALQSYWMKVHVPANFIGYGAFALAAMIGVADLLVRKGILASRLPGRGAGRRDVQGHRHRLCLLHHRHHPRRPVGGRSLGHLLAVGPEGNLGLHRVAQLRRLAAHPPDQGPARPMLAWWAVRPAGDLSPSSGSICSCQACIPTARSSLRPRPARGLARLQAGDFRITEARLPAGFDVQGRGGQGASNRAIRAR